MSVRHELLERELKRLGFRKAGQVAHEGAAAQQQGGGSHPMAGETSEHGD